jgi:hypothetical protein
MRYVRPPMSLLVPMVTRLVYFIYTGLAIVASEAALRIFDKDAYSCYKTGLFGSGDEVCKLPIELCYYLAGRFAWTPARSRAP